MSYNGSGTFNINTSGQPVVAGTIISAATFNALTADLATGLTTALTKDGQTTATARIPFAQGISSTLVTDASSVSTGSIITAGGVGIAKNLYVGGDTVAVNPTFNNLKLGYTTTATAAGTTTLTVASNYKQFFTGSTTQTLVLPVASTLTLGMSYLVENNSTGSITVQSSGLNTIATVLAGGSIEFTCVLISGTTAASWDYTSFVATATTVSDTANTSTGYFQLPAGTTDQRPGTPANGMLRVNNTTNKFEIYSSNTTGWVDVASLTNPPPSVEYLVVAGGGGGASYRGGAGGAGGFRTASGFSVVPSTPITVTVGAGGAGGTSAGNGVIGSDSVFSTITSVGGGRGGTVGTAGGTGGSGGGGGGGGAGGAATSSQGSAGGLGVSTAPYYGAGGGGGASAAGTDGTGSSGGAGGNGTASSITGSSITYAGGGAGGQIFSGGPAVSGGTGGGGSNTTTPANGGAGTVNTGGGGAGSFSLDDTTQYNGGAGGSGIVVVRYADTYDAAASTTGSPTVTVAGGYRVYKFTASGSITF